MVIKMLRISKKNSATLSDMVLAHRVAIRKCQKAEGTDDWYDANMAETITQMALEIALGEGDCGRKLAFLRDAYENRTDDLVTGVGGDALVALLRLKDLGLVDNV